MLDYIITAIVIFAILDAVFMFACVRVSDDIHTQKVSAPDETEDIIEDRGVNCLGLIKCMAIDEVIVQLKTLKDYCETSAEECPAKENVWTRDAVALRRAIDILSKVKAQNEGFGIDNAAL